MSRSDRWGVTKGDEELKQKVESTTKEEVDRLVKMQMEKKSGRVQSLASRLLALLLWSNIQCELSMKYNVS